jgi:putative membrane protein
MLLLASSPAGAASQVPPEEPSPSSAEQTPSAAAFARQASLAGLFDVEAAELASEKGQQEEIRQLGRDMAEEQRLANARLRAFAPKYFQDELSGDYAETLDRLRSVRLEQFDALFLEILAAHQARTVALFERYAREGEDDVLRGYASETLASLKDQQTRVKALR